MNTIVSKQPTGIIKPSALPDWLISHGIQTITAEECAHLFDAARNEIPQRLMRLRKTNQLMAVARGLWAVVPPEYREMGSPEPLMYLNDLMNYYECEYCIGWLSAAAMYGARHQAPQVFQIATDRQIRNRKVGRSELQFFDRSYVKSITKRRITTSRGSVIAPTPGAVMLMAAEDLMICGGIDNAATVITELAEENPDYITDVLTNAALFPNAAVSRLGWILDKIAELEDLDELERYCSKMETPAVLSPYDSRRGRIDKRWNIIENRRIEADI